MKPFLFVLAGLVAAPALADPYTIFIYETPDSLALRTDPGASGQAYWAGFAAYGDLLQAAGVLRGGAPLDVAADGAAPVLSGYFQIDVATPGAAAALAAQSPSLATGGSAAAVAHLPTPGMTN